MDLDDEYARILDGMDGRAVTVRACDLAKCRDLVTEALALLDEGGLGHSPAGLCLSEALSALELNVVRSGSSSIQAGAAVGRGSAIRAGSR